MARKKEYEDDDGRTIVDMSGVSRPSLLGGWRPQKQSRPDQPAEPEKARPWEEGGPVPKEDRKWYVLGALKAALLVALVFIVGLGLLIALLLWLWK